MFMFYVAFPIIGFIVVSIFIFFHVRKLDFIKNTNRINGRMPFITSILIAVITGFQVHDFLSLNAVVTLFIIILLLLNDILRFFFKNNKNHTIRTIIDNAIIVPVLLCLLLADGYYNSQQMTIVRYNVDISKTYHLNGLKIALVSDIHLGTFYGNEKLSKYAKCITNSKSDIVVLDGDIFDENTKRDEFLKACKILGNIKSKYGIYYVYGNHEIADYNGTAKFTVAEVKSELENNGIHVLDDETKLIDNRFYVIGRYDYWSNTIFGNGTTRSRKTINELTYDLDKSKYMILLDHHPVDIKKNEKAGIDLQLSGHTHGGQIWPTSYIPISGGENNVEYGIKRISDSFTCIVTSGMGGWGYPLRTGGRANEIVFIKLTDKK